jgi:hypothetical protein
MLIITATTMIVNSIMLGKPHSTLISQKGLIRFDHLGIVSPIGFSRKVLQTTDER